MGKLMLGAQHGCAMPQEAPDASPFRHVPDSHALVPLFARWLSKQQKNAMEYLSKENRVLREQFGWKRIPLSDERRPAGRQGPQPLVISLASNKRQISPPAPQAGLSLSSSGRILYDMDQPLQPPPNASWQTTETLLERAAAGDKEAVDRLFPMVYDELRELAQSLLRNELPGHTLNATAIVNEGYVRMVKTPVIAAENMAHFYAIAAQVLRRVLVDHARGRDRLKRGGEAERVSLDTSVFLPNVQERDIVEIDEVIVRLEDLHPRQAKIVELKFFGGLTSEQAATVLGVSLRTVEADWSMAKTWLRTTLARR